MYKSEKRIVEESFLLFQLGIVALNAINKDVDKYAIPVRAAFTEACKGKDGHKIIRRCLRLAHDSMPLIQNKTENKIDGHKFILTLHSLAEQIIDSGYPLPTSVIEAFEPFLELEANQSIKWSGEAITDSDWLKMKGSANKTAKKVLSKLKEQGYYL